MKNDIITLLDFAPDFLTPGETATLFRDLHDHIQWKQETLTLYGKQILTPRLTAWYGDEGISYRYSGKTFTALPWTEGLRTIKGKAEAFAGSQFNSVLLNYYRNGNDSMSWHSDDERELGINPVIASVNLGQVRRFDFRRRDDHADKHSVLLTDGSILVMKGEIQHYWQHQLPKSKRAAGARINLTFRFVH